jgi:hypothetical protein
MVRAAFTGRVKLTVAVRDWESVAVTWKLTGPAVGGVPVRKPAEVKVSHPGRPVPDQL